MSHLNFSIGLFPPSLVLLKVTCLVTLFDRQFGENIPFGAFLINFGFSVIFQHHDLVFSRNPERRSGKMLLCVGFLPWSDTKWQGGVWALVKFKNRSCENYMSWVYIHRMRWRRIFALLPTQSLQLLLLLSKAFNWRKKRKFAHVSSDSCQVQITVTAMSPLC